MSSQVNLTMIKVLLTVVSLLASVLPLGFGYGETNVERSISSRGKVFMFGVMGSTDMHLNMNDILINVVSSQSGIIGLLAPHFNMSAWHDIHVGVTSIHLSKDIICYSGIEDKGILLAAEFEVTIYVMTDGEGSVQRTFLLLPMDNTETGDVYVVSSYQPTMPHPSTYLVVAVNDYTVVSVRNKTALIKTFQLQSFNTYQFETVDFDPSGLLITVNDSVAVFSGSECATVMNGTRCHSLAQQLIPMASWGTSFVLTPLFQKPHNLARIYTGTRSARILLQNLTRVTEINIAAFDYLEILFETESLFVQSDFTPVQVMQYSTGFEDGNIGGSFMTTAAPMDSWMFEYTYKPLQLVNNYTHYLTLTSHIDDMDGIRMNEIPVGAGVATHDVVSVDGTFAVRTLVLKEGEEYTIKHETAKFGALAYGYANDVAYGFLLGLKTTGITCLQCRGVADMTTCETSMTCQIKQVCYVKRYMEVTSSDILYDAGCAAAPCPQSNKRFLTEGHMIQCTSCCSTNMCNRSCNGTGNFRQDTIGNIY